ncbi:MAG: hypothetical protein E6J90_28125 [Deltaproteobacteria bacterium]|nr:MAG: hypothetical protein E6J90_28125 [Deltaproteobacteria bacterium]
MVRFAMRWRPARSVAMVAALAIGCGDPAARVRLVALGGPACRPMSANQVRVTSYGPSGEHTVALGLDEVVAIGSFAADTEQIGVEVLIGGGEIGAEGKSAPLAFGALADGAAIPVLMAPPDGFCELPAMTEARAQPVVALLRSDDGVVRAGRRAAGARRPAGLHRHGAGDAARRPGRADRRAAARVRRVRSARAAVRDRSDGDRPLGVPRRDRYRRSGGAGRRRLHDGAAVRRSAADAARGALRAAAPHRARAVGDVAAGPADRRAAVRPGRAGRRPPALAARGRHRHGRRRRAVRARRPGGRGRAGRPRADRGARWRRGAQRVRRRCGAATGRRLGLGVRTRCGRGADDRRRAGAAGRAADRARGRPRRRVRRRGDGGGDLLRLTDGTVLVVGGAVSARAWLYRPSLVGPASGSVTVVPVSDTGRGVLTASDPQTVTRVAGQLPAWLLTTPADAAMARALVGGPRTATGSVSAIAQVLGGGVALIAQQTGPGHALIAELAASSPPRLVRLAGGAEHELCAGTDAVAFDPATPVTLRLAVTARDARLSIGEREVLACSIAAGERGAWGIASLGAGARLAVDSVTVAR